MKTPVENVSLKVTFNTKTGHISVDSNATPPELLQIITIIQSQLVGVFLELDAEIRKKRDDPASRLVIASADHVSLKGLVH
jgi:hypothetical protein